MVNVPKNHFPTILTVCILVVILVIAVYFVFFFNKTTIQGDMENLTELMRMDFSDVEVTDIKCKYVKDKAIGARTQIFIFLKESGELESKEYYFDSNGGGISDPDMYHIPP